MDEAEGQLKSVEEKWINNQMSFKTYNRWHKELTVQRRALKSRIQKLSHNEDEAFILLQKVLYQLEDINYTYLAAGVVQKQQLVRLVCDCSLYDKEGLSNSLSHADILS